MTERKARILALFALMLVPAFILAQGTAKPGLVKSSSGLTNSNTLPGTGTNTFTSSSTDANTSSTVAAFTMILLNDITGADLHTVWRDSASAVAMKLTESGALTTSDRITSGNGVATDSIVQVTDNGASGMLFLNSTATNPTEAGYRFDSGRTITTNLASFLNNTTAKARVSSSGFFYQPVQAITVADTGTGANATDTLTPTSNQILYTCNDTQGSDITVSETGAVAGTVIHISNTATTVCNFADTAGVTELAGAFAMAANDTLTLMYINSAWVEIARSNN